MGRIADWLESRTGALRGLRAFLNEEMPASVGWRNTLGSVAGAILLVQILTGVLLAIYYVPHPQAAYESLEWMAKHVTLGGFTRSLHYWGASFAVVAVFVHLCRVVFTGAYRTPREMNWITGLALFGVVVTLAYTGQLLPFDQMGYWAGTVGIEIASAAPLIGPGIRKMMIGGDTVGALTLTRFYALHIVVLPALLGVLVVAHLALLRRHGPMRAASDRTSRMASFYPAQFFRDMIAISFGLGGLALVAGTFGGPHSGPLNLADTAYQPRPEWYFLAHFELLKLTQGEIQKELVAFFLPVGLLLLLVALPWLDRGQSAAMGHRKPVVFVAATFIVAFAGLTAYGLSRVANESGDQSSAEIAASPGETAPAADAQTTAIELGRSVYRQQQCAKCHLVKGVGKDIGPDLSLAGIRLQEPFLRAWLKDPKALKPDSIMPPVTITGERFDALVAYVLSLKEYAPPPVE